MVVVATPPPAGLSDIEMGCGAVGITCGPRTPLELIFGSSSTSPGILLRREPTGKFCCSTCIGLWSGDLDCTLLLELVCLHSSLSYSNAGCEVDIEADVPRVVGEPAVACDESTDAVEEVTVELTAALVTEVHTRGDLLSSGQTT